MRGIMHKMALGGNPHFFVLINDMSFVWVGVRTESVKHILARCVVPSAAFHYPRYWAKWGGGGESLRTASEVSIIWTTSLRQEQVSLLPRSRGLSVAQTLGFLGLRHNFNAPTLVQIKLVSLHICRSPHPYLWCLWSSQTFNPLEILCSLLSAPKPSL